MPPEPNIYELHADIRNVCRTLDEMKHEAQIRGKTQTEILQKLAEHKTLTDYLIQRVSQVEADSRKMTAFVHKCLGVLAVLTPLAGYLLGKIF